MRIILEVFLVNCELMHPSSNLTRLTTVILPLEWPKSMSENVLTENLKGTLKMADT